MDITSDLRKSNSTQELPPNKKFWSATKCVISDEMGSSFIPEDLKRFGLKGVLVRRKGHMDLFTKGIAWFFKETLHTHGINIFCDDQGVFKLMDGDKKYLTPMDIQSIVDQHIEIVKIKSIEEGALKYVTDGCALKFAEELIRNRKTIFRYVEALETSMTITPMGVVRCRAGYDPETSVYYDILCSSPQTPCMNIGVDCLEDLLLEFDFIEDGGVSKAVAMSWLLLSVCRPHLYLAPAFIFTSDKPRGGKNFLSHMASWITRGDDADLMDCENKSLLEIEYSLGASLAHARKVLILDEWAPSTEVYSGKLKSTLTCERPTSRIIGSSNFHKPGDKLMMAITGVNVTPSRDMVRRSLKCTLKSKSSFRRLDFREQIITRRFQIQKDLIGFIEAYILHAKKNGRIPVGDSTGLDEFSLMCVEPLVWAGYLSPFESQKESAADDVREELTAEWIEAFISMMGDREKTITDMMKNKSFVEASKTFFGSRIEESELRVRIVGKLRGIKCSPPLLDGFRVLLSNRKSHGYNVWKCVKTFV